MTRLSVPLMIGWLVCSVGSAGDWPGWRGADRTDISRETGLLKKWPADGPKRIWLSTEAGVGYSGMSVVGDKLYTLGAYEDAVDLICMNARNGRILWSTTVSDAVLENGWGDGPRGTPTVDDNYVYAMSGEGDLVCADRNTGDKIWSTSMKDWGGRVPNWGYTESVLVDGDLVICTPGGEDGALLALNKLTGDKVWQSEEFTDRADYSSVIAVTHKGARQYIQLTQESLVGLAADSGKVLWKTDWPGRTAVIPTPIFQQGKVYVTSGYGVGCMLVDINGSAAEEVYSNKVMKNHHGGAILIDNHVYGYSDRTGWVCQNFSSGEQVWAERRKLGKGAVAYADGMLYCVSEDDGEVVLLKASPEGWQENGRFTLDPQTEFRSARGKIWTHPTIANGRLYLRDQDHLYCYDVAER